MTYQDGYPPGPTPGPDDEPSRPSVMVASAEALTLQTRRVDHPSIPEGAVGLGTYVHGHLVGRQAMAAETVEAYRRLLHTPRRLAYIAHEAEDGSVEGRLAALIRPSEIRELTGTGEDEEEDEPWKASVPSFEAEDEPAGDVDDERHVAVLPLGVVVRMAQRRTHPGDLAAEAADVLRSVVTEGPVEIVDQFLDTL